MAPVRGRWGIILALLAGCLGTLEDERSASPGAWGAGRSGLRLLTPLQYQNTIRDLLGEDVPVDAVGQWGS
jgi:hypothetical protein